MEQAKTKPLVSVIIPTYNSQRNIKKCLESIKNQSYKRTETLVVDRYSTDDTVKIARQFTDKVFLLSGERSEAKNYAAKKAKGDFLLFVDSDMIVTPKVIEECIKKVRQKNIDALVIPERYIGHGKLGEWRRDEKILLSKSPNKHMELPRFFKKDTFLKIGGYDERLVCGEDFDLYKRLEKEEYKTQKVSSEIIHLEGHPSLYHILYKAYYYGQSLSTLIKKRPLETVRRYIRIRLAFAKHGGARFHSLSTFLGFATVKLLESSAYLLGISSQLACTLSEKRGIKTLKNMVLKNKTAIANFSIITLIAIVIFRNFLFTAEWPGGGDVLGFVSRSYLYGKDFKWLYMWRPYSFGFIEGINFMDFFLMMLYLVFKDPSWTVKAFMFLSYLTAGFFMYLFTYRYIHMHMASLASSLVYMLNQWLFSQFTDAHVQIIFSYALAPLIFMLLDKALQTGNFKDTLLLSLGLSLFVTSFHPECIVICGVFLSLFAVVFIVFPTKTETFKTRLLRFLKVSLPSALLLFLLSAFFLIPFFMNVRSPYFASSYKYPLEDAFSCSYQNVMDAFTLRAVERWGYVDLVDVYSELGLPNFPVYTLLSTLFFLAYCVLLIRRDRYTLFFAISATISIFIAKGPHPPFGQVFIWAWFNLPHFAVFRAANRWVMMAVFSHAFFVSLLVYYLKNYLTTRLGSPKGEKISRIELKIEGSADTRRIEMPSEVIEKILRKLRKLLRVSVIILLVAIFISGFLACFFFFFYGLQVYTPPKLYRRPYEWIANQRDDYKVVSIGSSHVEWKKLPNAKSDFASSAMYTNLGWGHDIGFDSSFIHDKPVLQDGGWDPKPRGFVDYLRFHLAREQLTDDLYKILGTFAYKYVVIPPYTTNETREFFLNQKGYRVLYNETSLILQNEYAMPRIFAVNRSMFIVGGFKSFDALCKIESFKHNETALFFASPSENNMLENELFTRSQALIFVDSTVLDLAMISLYNEKKIICVGDYGAASINTMEYWVKMPSWRNLGMLVLSGDTLTTYGKNKIHIPFQLSSEGHHDLWLRVGFAPNRGKLKIFVDGEPVRELRSEALLWSGLKWVNITRLSLTKGKHLITLENDGSGYNDVDAVAVVKPSELKSKINEITRLLQVFPGRLMYLLEAENVFLALSDTNWYWTKEPYIGYLLRSKNLKTNVAPYASVNAASSSPPLEACYAVDGDLNTRWASEKEVLPQWLELTWDTPQELYDVRIIFEQAYATDYSIQTWNGTCWVDHITVSENTLLERTHRFAEPVETKKMRIYVTGFSVYDRVSIWELEVYSTQRASAYAKITLPRRGNYMLAAKVATGSKYGSLYVRINDTLKCISCKGSVDQFEWREADPLTLDAGEHEVRISAVGRVELDKILIYSLTDEESCSLHELFTASNPVVSLTYQKVNPCTFKVNVSAESPFTLIFSDTFSHFWKAYINGEEVPSTLAYSMVNSFYINKTGLLTITIHFTGQNYADAGLKISLASFTSIVVAAPIVSIILRKRETAKR